MLGWEHFSGMFDNGGCPLYRLNRFKALDIIKYLILGNLKIKPM